MANPYTHPEFLVVTALVASHINTQLCALKNPKGITCCAVIRMSEIPTVHGPNGATW
jgi:hypothetical protein